MLVPIRSLRPHEEAYLETLKKVRQSDKPIDVDKVYKEKLTDRILSDNLDKLECTIKK
jgi:hypothetical protein